VRVPRFPIKYGQSPATVRRLAPNLGEHTDEVIAEFAGLPKSH
jgi:crotonobetainyl-CoA:carnitine CoA-transferase CaiB-like acyl-CoA transferase